MLEVLAIKWYGPSEGCRISGRSVRWNFLQNLGHLITTLAAADVDDHICVEPFYDLVLGHESCRYQKPPGIAAVPPLASGNMVSMIRWPVINGTDAG